MKTKYVKVNNLKISEKLLSFVNDELLKNTNITSKKFWESFDDIVHELAPKNKELLNVRNKLQKEIDDWHITNKEKRSRLMNIKNF